MQVHGMRSPGGQIEEFQLRSPVLAEDMVCIIWGFKSTFIFLFLFFLKAKKKTWLPSDSKV